MFCPNNYYISISFKLAAILQQMFLISDQEYTHTILQFSLLQVYDTFHTQTNKHTLTGRYRRAPCVVAEWRAAAGCCGVADEMVTTVASPAHHAVNMAAALRGDGAVARRVWGGAVQSWRKHNQRCFK